MTDYDTMPAGREMDALVAEKMGWTWEEWKTGAYPLSPYKGRSLYDPSGRKAGIMYLENYTFEIQGRRDSVKAGQWIDAHYWPGGEGGARKLPAYSTNIADAWKVVEHLYPKTVVLTMSGVSVYADDLCQVFGHDGKVLAEGRGQEMSLAICRAGLKMFEK